MALLVITMLIHGWLEELGFHPDLATACIAAIFVIAFCAFVVSIIREWLKYRQ